MSAIATEIAALRARIAELEARAPVVTEAQADALLQKVCGCYRCGRGAVGNEERCDQMLKLAHAEFAALAVAGTGDCWPSIETAPKDGTEFLASQDGEVYQCRWSIKDDGQGSRQAGWYDLVGRSFEQPTHWLPLPPAPSKGGATP